MKRILCLVASVLMLVSLYGQEKIFVAAEQGDMTRKLQEAIDRAKESKSKFVEIELQNGDYHISRKNSTAEKYYVSNTTSETERPDKTKYIGLWLKGLKNITINGNGARLVTHGEMTSFVIDSCENIIFKNFMITAADPTVPEFEVKKVGDHFMDVKIHPQSKYKLDQGKFAFVGENWSFSKGIAQIYDPEKDITWRSWSPLKDLRGAKELESGLIRFDYDFRPEAQPGMIFQMREGFRDQVCGLIQFSKGITFENLHFAFLGNFGIVGQMSENITYRHLTFEPEHGSGRTCAGFADFVQMSGCKGTILIENSRFSGAQDDPINIHGTHLAVTEFISANEVLVKYMHGQTYGFQSFLEGNEVEFINAHSLLPVASYKVKKAKMKNPREIILTLNKSASAEIRAMKDLVVENVTYTPEVIIKNNYFSRIPTRGILITTRRKVLIEGNTFFRMQMSGLLIADDARSWFESGMVRDVMIRNNHFLECNTPVILIAPENDKNDGYVHSNINIHNNRFLLKGADAISAKSVDGINITNNLFQVRKDFEIENLVDIKECNNVLLKDNVIENVSSIPH
ncbi:right-handed parallel beta-helix repeat-containing protein [Sphingobacterium cellulitidis]|uniref:right-handed parallel beta-helix repeat-containing protein n=1 Tax=Sphingobacterium cellulitidis TaxID=1768011 RepID=UPI003C7AE282